ncbi:oligosaccharide flippase family protein [Pseudomonas sp. BCRC 81390]|nr:oligosaccharide flippase family protein [Pseudomonas sp. BCRC 81390]
MLNTGFVRSVLLVAGGALVSQGLIVAVTPVLTRLFSPESFGVLAAFTSVLTILVALASLKYELAIPQAKADKHAFEVAVLSFSVLAALGLLATFLIVALWMFPWVELPAYCWFIPPGLLFAGAFQIASYVAIRNKDFSGLTAANIQRSVVQSILQVSAGLAAFGSGALILGYVLSQGAAGAKIIRKAFTGRSVPAKLRLLALARKYKRFPVMAAPAALLNAAAMNVSPFVIIYAYGVHEAGLFALAQRAMGVPMAFLGTAIANVYLSEIPRLVETSPDEVIVFYKRALKTLVVIGLPIVLGAALCLFYTVELLFGSGWSGAAILMLVLVPMFFGQFVVSPLSQTLNVIERQDVQLQWDFFRLCVPNLGFLMVALSGFSFVEALTSFSVLMFFMYVMNVVVTFWILKRRQAGILRVYK